MTDQSPFRATFSLAPQVRAILLAVALLAAVGLASALWLLARDGTEPQTMTAAQAAAVARLTPYAQLLEEDFDAGVAALPSDFGRTVEVAADGLSASGLISLQADGDRCAAIRLEIGPGYLLDGDPAGIEVTGPAILDGALCPAAPEEPPGS